MWTGYRRSDNISRTMTAMPNETLESSAVALWVVEYLYQSWLQCLSSYHASIEQNTDQCCLRLSPTRQTPIISEYPWITRIEQRHRFTRVWPIACRGCLPVLSDGTGRGGSCQNVGSTEFDTQMPERWYSTRLPITIQPEIASFAHIPSDVCGIGMVFRAKHVAAGSSLDGRRKS